MEGEGYTIRTVDIPACAVNAPHIRNRLYWVAVVNADRQRFKECFGKQSAGQEQLCTINPDDVADSTGIGSSKNGEKVWNRSIIALSSPTHDILWDNWSPVTSSLDGKTRRAEPTIPLLVNGLPGRVPLMRGYGNAIVPPLAAQVIMAFMDVMGIEK